MPHISKDEVARVIELRTRNRVRVSYDDLRNTFTLVTHTRARAYAVVYCAYTSAVKILTDIARGWVRWMPWTGTEILPARGRKIQMPVTFPDEQP